jgi:hypothetical protein
MEMSETQNLSDLLQEGLPFSVEDSPVNPSAQPGSGEARKMTETSGRQCAMLSNLSGPLGLLVKTCLDSPLWTNSEEFVWIWKLSAINSQSLRFQLTPLGQSTGGSESSLWRTPDAGSKGNVATPSKCLLNGTARPDQQVRLADQVMNPKLWPTAHANCSTGAGTQGREGGINLQTAAKLWPTARANENDQGPENREKVKKAAERGMGSWTGQGRGATLTTMAKLWPTPRKEGYDSQGKGHGDLQYEVKASLLPPPNCMDHMQPRSQEALERARKIGGCSNLKDTFSGSLNPRFVCELMGYEVDHTNLKHWETLLSPSKPTRSSKRSRKSNSLQERLHRLYIDWDSEF